MKEVIEQNGEETLDQEITQKFHIARRISESTNRLDNGKPLINRFNCEGCGHEMNFAVSFWKGGWPLSDLYKKNDFISKDKLLESQVAKKGNAYFRYLDELVLHGVHANYSSKTCPNCNAHYFTVFGSGEIQPSRNEIQISGVWKIELIV